LTKLPGIIVGLPAVYAIYAILGRRALETNKLLGFLCAAISVLVTVLGYYLWARHLSVTYPPYQFAGADKFISFEKISDWIQQYYFVPDVIHQLLGWQWTWPVAILVCVGLLIPPPLETKKAPWVFHLLGLALLIQYLIEAEHLASDPNNMDLYNPFAAAMGGHAIASVSQVIWKRGFQPLKITAIVGVIVIIGLFGKQQLKRGYSPTYASSYHLGTKLSRIAGPNDLIISFGLNPCAIYYSKLRGWPFPPAELWYNHLAFDTGELDIKALQSLWQQGAKWLVISEYNDFYITASDIKAGRALWGDGEVRSTASLWMYILNNFELYEETEDGMIFRLPAFPQ
jgi:hypothetical protein